MILSERFEQALRYAFSLHCHQKRKCAEIPYFSHLMCVSALVMEDGGSEDEVIAALLHDAPEDQGGRAVLDEIQQLFGDHVAQIVDGCTDTFEHPKPDWRHRKETYVIRLRHATPEVLRVSLADKLHNARSILRGLDVMGESFWDEFNGGKEGTLWYYQALLGVFIEASVKEEKTSPLLKEFALAVRCIQDIVNIRESKIE